jgi:hypothetical protein
MAFGAWRRDLVESSLLAELWVVGSNPAGVLGGSFLKKTKKKEWLLCLSLNFVENIIAIYLNWIGSKFLTANFPLSYFVRQIINSAHLFTPIRVYQHLPYVYCCTAHYSSVSFWTQNRLDQLKVITCAHPCHHFHNLLQILQR